jgi:hypothetical protein
MSLNLLRGTSVVNNIWNDTMRKRVGLSFRKTLGVYNYKVKPAEYYKNPHQVPLRMKERLRNQNREYATRDLNAIRRNSIRPFGRFSTKGRFVKNFKQVPNFNIPDLTDFPLKPYMSWKATVPGRRKVITYSQITHGFMLQKLRRILLNSDDKNVRNLADEIFNTEEGKAILKEYFSRLDKRTKLKIANF